MAKRQQTEAEPTHSQLVEMAKSDLIMRGLRKALRYPHTPTPAYAAIDEQTRAELEREAADSIVQAHKREVESGMFYTGKSARSKGWRTDRYGN